LDIFLELDGLALSTRDLLTVVEIAREHKISVAQMAWFLEQAAPVLRRAAIRADRRRRRKAK
jgi:hypothetical protein